VGGLYRVVARSQEDNSDTDIYMVATSGGAPVKLTSSKKPETSPRWSPDGRYTVGPPSGRAPDHQSLCGLRALH
jgi:hypothetical protein